LKRKTILSAAALALTLGLAFGQSAEAVDFKARGIWSMGFGVGDSSLTKDVTTAGAKQKGNNSDQFVSRQRVLLFLDAIASENLMGSVQFKLGPMDWGKSGQGSALGADGTLVRVTQANMQWSVPQTDLKFKMGLQYLALPNAALVRGSYVLVTKDSPSAANAETSMTAPDGYVYVKVATGISDDDYIEVKSGLQEGDTIAYDNSSVSATDFYSTMMVSAEGGDE